ncbi:chromosome partitioning protein [Neobacillus bataviensis LMG 21833]|uniref:Chromosome partitioning protein n=1 Tax=Neobacillus bataviensis LMG 21833 TaxID=1117379 RepID=K6C352_9BACI|nr:chromosome partitioning protein [Neobacillus bataviensis LMG 21833]
MCKRSSRYLLSIAAISVFILSGCVGNKTPAEKMYDVLEDVVAKEKVFEEQQDPLVTLEKKEKRIYDQIIELGMKEYDQIVKLSDEAIQLTDERKKHMEKETKSLKESEQAFKKIADIKDEFDDTEVIKTANELNDVMMQRYQAHEWLYKEYSDALTYDKELYGMFKNKNLPLEDLEAQVNKLNDQYKQVFDANEKFNMLTDQYNDKKQSFYKKAGLKSNK